MRPYWLSNPPFPFQFTSALIHLKKRYRIPLHATLPRFIIECSAVRWNRKIGKWGSSCHTDTRLITHNSVFYIPLFDPLVIPLKHQRFRIRATFRCPVIVSNTSAAIWYKRKKSSAYLALCLHPPTKSSGFRFWQDGYFLFGPFMLETEQEEGAVRWRRQQKLRVRIWLPIVTSLGDNF